MQLSPCRQIHQLLKDLGDIFEIRQEDVLGIIKALRWLNEEIAAIKKYMFHISGWGLRPFPLLSFQLTDKF